MEKSTTHGFLMLADITGFTPFIAESELEHSQEILQKLLKRIISGLTPAFRLAEVEGDAVFVYADSLPRREMLLEIIDSVYFGFRDHKATFSRLRTCDCRACEMASSLDLKFIVHYGDYVMNNVGGKDKPLGPSVNTAHRLLKNHVREVTGWTAYALFTKGCLPAVESYPEQVHEQVEEYDHIGKVETFSLNLDERYKDFMAERRVYLSLEDADFVVHSDFPVSPPMLWEWANDPKKRTMWYPKSDWRERTRPGGGSRKGGTNHCVNSKVIEHILDYKPFEYYTSSLGRSFLNFMLTIRFEVIEGGTRLYWHVKMKGILPKGLRRRISKFLLVDGLGIYGGFEKLLQLVEEDMRQREVEMEG